MVEAVQNLSSKNYKATSPTDAVFCLQWRRAELEAE